jgi:hypothetical protein
VNFVRVLWFVVLDRDGERTVLECTAQEVVSRTGWSTVLTAIYDYAAGLAVGLRGS